MPITNGLEIVGYEDLGEGRFRVGEFVATPFTDNLEWGQGRIQGSLHDPNMTHRVAVLGLTSLQKVAPTEDPYSTCTDGRFRLTTYTNRLVPVRKQVIGDNFGTAFMMAETLGADFYEDPTKPLDERQQTVAERLASEGEIPCIHDDCGLLAQLPLVMNNAAMFTRQKSFKARTEQSLGGRFNQHTYEKVAGNLERHVSNDPYKRYGSDMVWRLMRGRDNLEAIQSFHTTGPYGAHGHQEKIGLWLGESVTHHALNQRLLAEIGGDEGIQAFGINQEKMLKIATIIGGGIAELVDTAMHAGTMGTHAGHGTLAVDLPTFSVEKAE